MSLYNVLDLAGGTCKCKLDPKYICYKCHATHTVIARNLVDYEHALKIGYVFWEGPYLRLTKRGLGLYRRLRLEAPV